MSCAAAVRAVPVAVPVVVPVVLAAVLAVVGGCTAGDFSVDVDAGFVDCDAGVPVVVLDDGQCAPELTNEAGGEGEGEGEGGGDPDPRSVFCGELLVKACGVGDECGADPGCVAADLVSRFEPERCEGARSDNVSFPPCTDGTCDRLVAKVCGQSCLDAPSCPTAQTLQTRSDDGDASASASCASALSDETLFPACSE